MSFKYDIYKNYIYNKYNFIFIIIFIKIIYFFDDINYKTLKEKTNNLLLKIIFNN